MPQWIMQSSNVYDAQIECYYAAHMEIRRLSNELLLQTKAQTVCRSNNLHLSNWMLLLFHDSVRTAEVGQRRPASVMIMDLFLVTL